MKRLETKRLILRQWEPEDADFVLDLYSRWKVQRFIGTHPQVMRERAEAEERIHAWRNIHQQPMAHPSHAIWAVQLRNPAQFALGSGLDKVVAVTAPANTASQKVCLRIGMTHRGQTDRYYNSTCELFEAKTPH